MLRRLYDFTMSLAAKPRAKWFLGGVSFIESSFFPIPPDVLLIPMVLANRAEAWRLAFICSVTSVLGGMFGYLVGAFFFELIGAPIIDFYGYADKFIEFSAAYNEWGGWIVAFFGLTPFPYKVITIASGVTHLDIFVFIFASVMSRSLRFFIVAGLLWKFGAPIQVFIEKYLGLLTILFFVLLIGGFVAIKYLL
ncbi:MAG: cytochrome B [Sneathiella sp.]|jgi:membrane protein YqaA with SNARE-associated domain|uniref:YqaA family protein n=1 Tax=Sneathiella sp. TaxID=1964365 RepID=UPI000C65CE3D|nr:cytochrome B [Sneathiella sp.]|tara:strand:+ start:747 stop:1328 length:582 start_codon:yes stop_codon:yes gene_type:complete